ncbi:MAG: energy-coupling factor ABC transporter ATP-binding protein [Pseudomonadota bacterium]
MTAQQAITANKKSTGKIINYTLGNISLTRNKNTILNNIFLQLNSEHFILMTGQNGSGKSTLLKIISGLLQPDSFFLEENNNKRSWSKIKNKLRKNLCYLHQTPYLFSGTVYDNIAYGLQRQGVHPQQIEQRVEEALQTIALEHLRNRDSNALSGGEKQRVAIARSWVIRPSFILLDEPFANMDKKSRHNCYDLINQLKEDNIGVILTSHDPHSGDLAFNRHLHLYQGVISEK